MNLIRRMDKLEKEFKAYHNIEFLDSPQARPIRIISEYSYPEKVFTEEKVDKVIVFFGSARIQPLDSPNLTPIQKEMAQYYEDARALAYKITNWTKTLQENEAFMLFEKLLSSIKQNYISTILRIEPTPQIAANPMNTVVAGESLPRVGRNDPCPCGSGKKYKKCHGK